MASQHKWGMVVDIDRCTGCQACVIACQSENNIAVNEEIHFLARRAMQWIRIDRYWDGDTKEKGVVTWPDVKARFIPVLCQHCENAPCEPVCPVYATYHNNEGLNVQVYNRCIGTRYCANNCPYQVRFFNFRDPQWPKSLWNQLNPDVTIRSRGIMEKCTFCIQRIRRAERVVEGQRGEQLDDTKLKNGNWMPACVSACPTDTLTFGDFNDPNSQASKKAQDKRHYKLLEELGTDPNVVYLKKVDPQHAQHS